MDILEELENYRGNYWDSWLLCEKSAIEIKDLRQRLAAAEAKIDALMLEYCPEDMTPDQLKTWGENQKVSEIELPESHILKENITDVEAVRMALSEADLLEHMRSQSEFSRMTFAPAARVENEDEV